MGHVDSVKRFFGAFRERDLETLYQLMDPEIVFHLPGDHLMSGDHTGAQQVIATFARSAELTGGTFKSEVRGIAPNGDKVLVLTHVNGERNGRTLDMDGAFVVDIVEGRWKEIWGYYMDPEQAEAFWS